jgi:hypothetical protein
VTFEDWLDVIVGTAKRRIGEKAAQATLTNGRVEPMSTTLEQKATALRQKLNAPTEKEIAAAELQKVEAQIAAEREATGKAAAHARLAAIRDSYTPLVRQLEQDGERLREAASAYRAAVEDANTHAQKLTTLRAEASALADRFELASPVLAAVRTPAECGTAVAMVAGLTLQAPADAGDIYEKDETGLRRRRTYREVGNTEASAIIVAAGPKPWPELTPRQQEVVAFERRRLGARA